MRQRTLVKVAVGLAAVGILGVLFVRSAKNVGAEPYTIPSDRLAPWTLELDPAVATSGVLLALWPPASLSPPLFSQIFARSGVSLSGPNRVGMPLVLESEFERGLAGTFSPDALVELARVSGVESTEPKLLCMASRRVSQPGSTREVFFARVEHASFDQFRRQIAARLNAAGGFDPASLTPVLIVAGSDANFSNWLPLPGDPVRDCLAPIVVQ